MKLKYLYDQIRSKDLHQTVDKALERGKTLEVSEYRQELSPVGFLDALMLNSYGLSSEVERYMVKVDGESKDFSIVKNRDLEGIRSFLDARGVQYELDRCLR